MRDQCPGETEYGRGLSLTAVHGGGCCARWAANRDTTHACPPAGSNVMPCCGRTPFDVSRWDRMTLDPTLVTCHE